MGQLRIIIFMILIIDVITKNVMSVLTNDTNQEDEISVTKILHFDTDKMNGMIIGLLLNIYVLLFMTLLFCICKTYFFIRRLYIPLRCLWYHFISWFFRVFLRNDIFEIPVRVIPNEMDLVYINPDLEETSTHV